MLDVCYYILNVRSTALGTGDTILLYPLWIGATGEIRTHDFQDLQSRALGLSATVACWYLVTGSNRRHPTCKEGAATAELTRQIYLDCFQSLPK